jgi:cytochrome c biogenesis protein
MSTAETLLRSVASVWRALRSMRTALILLLVVGVASMFGSLLPQIPNTPARVEQYALDHPALARIWNALGLFDVYGSWWFTLVYVLLLVSLASCLVPRTRALLREARRRPQPLRDLEGMRHFAEGRVGDGPGAVLDRSRRVLRRRRFRVSGSDGVLAAEKGGAREIGSLLFHWSFFLLLVGVIYGKGFGLTGLATVVEGETWTEAHANYDLPPREGRFFTEGMHSGLQLRLTDFDATYLPSGLPDAFVSRVEVVKGGRVEEAAEIRVNAPLEREGVKVYQAGYGWAPVIEVRHEGELLAGRPVVFFTDTPEDFTRPWRGVIKLPSLRPQVGIEFELFPDAPAGFAGLPMLEADAPFLSYRAYRGDLGLDRPQSVFALDRRALDAWESGGLGLGQRARLPGGVELSFPAIREYTQWQVKRDPGLLLMALAAALILAGLLPALYSSRRRLWVRAVPEGEGTRLQVAGFALQRRAAFEEEFRSLVGELVQ